VSLISNLLGEDLGSWEARGGENYFHSPVNFPLAHDRNIIRQGGQSKDGSREIASGYVGNECQFEQIDGAGASVGLGSYRFTFQALQPTLTNGNVLSTQGRGLGGLQRPNPGT
jgi:hypothetical protein